MLKLKYLFENYELAKDCLTLYDAEQESLDELLPRFRISSNAIHPFWSMDADKLCFLRLSPVEEKDIDEVQSEIQLIEWLIAQGFPAMRPHAMKDGRLCAVKETEWGTYNVSCFEAVRGKTLEDCEGSLELIRGYGKTLGRMHRLLKAYPHAETRRDHAALMREIRERFEHHHAPQALLAEWESVDAALQALPADADRYGVVHYDFEADNVLYSAKTDAFGVIDFDDAIRCWYSLDAARAVDCLSDVAEDIDPVEAEEAFMSGYREETAFTPAQEAEMPLMRRLVALQEYATILHVLSEPAPSEPDWMTFIVEKLTRKLRMIEAGLQN